MKAELQKPHREGKADLIEKALCQWQVDPCQVAMIGDRQVDILGAKANGVYAIGVRYGYGQKDEFIAADLVVDSIAQLAQFLL